MKRDGVGPVFDKEIQWVDDAAAIVGESSGGNRAGTPFPGQDLLTELLAIGH